MRKGNSECNACTEANGQRGTPVEVHAERGVGSDGIR